MKHYLVDLLKTHENIALDDLTGLLEAETKKALHELKNEGVVQEQDNKISLTKEAAHSYDDARHKFLDYLKHHIAK